MKKHISEFTLNCLISHPSMDPENITRILKLEPFLTQKAGDKTITPIGTELDGRYPISRWSYIIDIKTEMSLNGELNHLLDHLFKYKGFFKEVRGEGGECSIFFRIGNPSHQALMINPETMFRMYEMNFDFGFEVFE